MAGCPNRLNTPLIDVV